MKGFNIIRVTETKITNSNPVDCWPMIPGYDFQYEEASGKKGIPVSDHFGCFCFLLQIS